MSKPRLMEQLGLKGLIHIWGRAGSGKTMLASKIASDESSYSKVEWINTDSKQSFVQQLKQDIEAGGGNIGNVAVTMVNDRDQIKDMVLNLNKTLEPDVSLVVIDSLTRVLDMARKNPILWGREMIEEVLPALAGLVNKKVVNVIITSETRTVDEQRTIAVHQTTIAKWTDHDVHLVRSSNGDASRIIRETECEKQMGVLDLDANSLVLSQHHSNLRKTMEV
ncbi:MAG: NB-ARC domain-containing protein [Candidatus Thorarchaeota archaeon]